MDLSFNDLLTELSYSTLQVFIILICYLSNHSLPAVYTLWVSFRALHSTRGSHPCASHQRPAEKPGPLRRLQRRGLQLPLLPQHLH